MFSILLRLTCSKQANQLLLFTQSNNIRMISLSNDTLSNATMSSSPNSLQSYQFITSFGSTVRPVERDNEDTPVQPNLMDNVVPVDSVKSPLALDFDDRDDTIYWSDIGTKTISRAHLNGSAQQLIVANNLGTFDTFLTIPKISIQ